MRDIKRLGRCGGREGITISLQGSPRLPQSPGALTAPAFPSHGVDIAGATVLRNTGHLQTTFGMHSAQSGFCTSEAVGAGQQWTSFLVIDGIDDIWERVINGRHQ